MKKNLVLILAILILSATSFFAQMSDKNAKQTSSVEKKPVAESLIEGTEVVIKITAVKDNAISNNEFDKPSENNKFVSIQMVINNKGKADWEVDHDYLKLKDAEGNVYDKYSTEITLPELKSGIVDGGDIVKGWVTFEVSNAVDIKSLKLRYENRFETIKSGWIDLKAIINK